MDIKEQVTKWVENEIGDIINKDLEEKIIQENSSFDVETYVNSLLDKHFSFNYSEQLKDIFNQDSYDDIIYSELEHFTEERSSLHDSLEFDSTEYHSVFEGEIVKNLESNFREVRKKTLKVLEASVEDFINQPSWNGIIESLEKTLTKTRDKEICNLVLKVFQKLLRCSKKPQALCKGFTAAASVLTKLIVLFNLKTDNQFEQTYTLRNSKWENHLESNNPISRNLFRSSTNVQVLIKLMWLLVDCQQQTPAKLARFNESRFREIIFAFVRLLSSTTASESKKLSGFEVLSVLDPTATWCRYYCHTAVGRSLLCSALKKYKTFFVQLVEIIINHTKIKRCNRLPSIGNSRSFNSEKSPKNTKTKKILSPGYETKKYDNHLKVRHLDERINGVRSAPVEKTGTTGNGNERTKNLKSSEWVVQGIPRKIVNEAVFCHSVSFVSCLIQFRHGQALFPVLTTTKQKLLSIQDFCGCLSEYIENMEYDVNETGINFTSNYKVKLLEILEILKNLKCSINSSRSTER